MQKTPTEHKTRVNIVNVKVTEGQMKSSIDSIVTVTTIEIWLFYLTVINVASPFDLIMHSMNFYEISFSS